MTKQTSRNLSPNEDNKPFETDAHKLSSRHMADQTHVISDEEMQNLNVGVSPSKNEALTKSENNTAESG